MSISVLVSKAFNSAKFALIRNQFSTLEYISVIIASGFTEIFSGHASIWRQSLHSAEVLPSDLGIRHPIPAKIECAA
jgi:hypothetical protein